MWPLIAAISIAPATLSIDAPMGGTATLEFTVLHTQPAEILLVDGDSERPVAQVYGSGASTVRLRFEFLQTKEIRLCATQLGLPARSCARLRVTLK